MEFAEKVKWMGSKAGLSPPGDTRAVVRRASLEMLTDGAWMATGQATIQI